MSKKWTTLESKRIFNNNHAITVTDTTNYLQPAVVTPYLLWKHYIIATAGRTTNSRENTFTLKYSPIASQIRDTVSSWSSICNLGSTGVLHA